MSWASACLAACAAEDETPHLVQGDQSGSAGGPKACRGGADRRPLLEGWKVSLSGKEMGTGG